MAWEFYGLDRVAQELVLNARIRDRDSLNQSFKMRESVAYGLERFWGEHLRLMPKEPDKGTYWKQTWDELVELMKKAGITLPSDRVSLDNPDGIKKMAEKLWEIPLKDQRVALAVLTQLCDSLVWWTQRYKGTGDAD